MSCEIFCGIIGALIGGAFSLIGTVIALVFESKRERELQINQFSQQDKEWVRENRLKLYIELTEKLENFKLDIDIYSASDGNAIIYSDSVLDNLKVLSDYIENQKGYLSLFLPNSLNSEIMRFRANLYKIVITPELQEVNLNNPQESELFKIIIDGKKISMNLKKIIVGTENI